MDRKLGSVDLIALMCVFFSWFFTDTVTVTLGSLHHGVRFYDLAAVITDPTRMFFGAAISFRTFLFGAVCVCCLSLPLCLYWRTERWLWITLGAPLMLILACGSMLYLRTSGEFLATPSDSAGVGSGLTDLVNGLVHRGSGAVARHLNVGWGGYGAFAASIVLAIRGWRGFRKQGRGAY